VVKRGRVPEWLYPMALRMSVTGFVPPRVQRVLTWLACAAGVALAACAVAWWAPRVSYELGQR